MESGTIVIIIIIGIIILYAVYGKFSCDICGGDFGKKSLKYKWTHDGKGLTVCSKCNNRLKNKIHSKNFDKFFNERKRETIREDRESIPSSVKDEVWN